MAVPTKSTSGRRNVLLWLIGMTILYQVVFQFFMMRRLEEADEVSDEQCTLDANLEPSSRCREVHLFRSWHSNEGDIVVASSNLSQPNISVERQSIIQPSSIVVGNTTPLEWGHEEAFNLTQDPIQLGSLSTPMLDQVEELQKQLCDSVVSRNSSLCMEFEANKVARERAQKLALQLTAAAQRAETMHKLARSARQSDMMKDLQEHTKELEVGLAQISHEHEAWQTSFEQQVQQAQLELCAEPHHQDQPNCLKLLAEDRRMKALRTASQLNMTRELEQRTSELQRDEIAIAENHASWEHEFQAKVDSAHLKLCEDPQRRDRSDCIKFRRHMHQPVVKAIASESELNNPEDWSHTFMDAVHSAQREMCAEPHRRDREDCKHLLVEIAADEKREAAAPSNVNDQIRQQTTELEARLHAVAIDHAAWEQKFEERIRETHRQLCIESGRHDSHDCAEFMVPSTAAPALRGRALRQKELPQVEQKAKSGQDDEWSQAFTRLVRSTQREMCEAPHRRDRSDCVEILSAIAEAERQGERIISSTSTTQIPDQHAIRVNLRASIVKETAGWHAAWDLDASKRAIEHDKWQKELIKSNNLTLPEAKKSLRGNSIRELHWSNVKSTIASGWFFSNTGNPLVREKELQTSRWSGMIPKVACITAIPSGISAANKMKEFIMNFYAQNYEGAVQLILVYHHTDEKAAQIVELYSDGTSIKGVAAQDSAQFPSTTALRYGAWLAAKDAEVVAHWDFDGEQHPDRLSLQVRALAYSGRPASLLTGPEAANTSSIAQTLLGEAAWMRRNWYPLLDPQETMLASLTEDQIVVVSTDATSA